MSEAGPDSVRMQTADLPSTVDTVRSCAIARSTVVGVMLLALVLGRWRMLGSVVLR